MIIFTITNANHYLHRLIPPLNMQKKIKLSNISLEKQQRDCVISPRLGKQFWSMEKNYKKTPKIIL